MKKNSCRVSGQALVGEELAILPVDIIIENGTIIAIEETRHAPDVWICPAFFNAHTHLGDTIAMDCRKRGDLESLVTPPDGLKHRILAAASHNDLVAGMHASIQGMISGGTAGCADFREGGCEGVTALRDAAAGLAFRPFIFGREGGEGIADGLGISSTRDVPGMEKLVAKAKRAGKKIALHAGERDAKDVDAALALDPDLLIHCTHATKRQLRECAERQIPIAVCPRSNWILGVTSSAQHPPVQIMQDLGCRLLLGTDNVMFVPPDMFSEMAFTSTVYRIDPEVLLGAAVRGSELTGSSFFIRKGAQANLFTIDPAQSTLHFSRDPVTSIIKRAFGSIIGNNVFNL
ncbi:MAG: amidohydrolase family protein [Methanoregula sp.]|jgi:cytosine/adenosine deaminase-related metal-dependent hydrolase|nr:amidohydrolase family protein [Methanoregula sp.]